MKRTIFLTAQTNYGCGNGIARLRQTSLTTYSLLSGTAPFLSFCLAFLHGTMHDARAESNYVTKTSFFLPTRLTSLSLLSIGHSTSFDCLAQLTYYNRLM